MIEFKSRVLAERGAAPAADRRVVGVDLRDDWAAALREKGFDTDVPTAWIAEGLLIYLPPEAWDRLFDTVTALSAPGSPRRHRISPRRRIGDRSAGQRR